MQAQFDASRPGEVWLGAVNLSGYESGLPDIALEGDRPVLQDVEDVDAWTLWGANWRDVFVVDGESRLVGIYNLTEHNLEDPANVAELTAIIEGSIVDP